MDAFMQFVPLILIFAIISPKSAPAVRTGGNFDAAFWGKVALTLIPPLALKPRLLGGNHAARTQPKN